MLPRPFGPHHIRSIPEGGTMPVITRARQQWEALSDSEKLKIADAVFKVLDDFPEWDGETCNIIGDTFEENGVDF